MKLLSILASILLSTFSFAQSTIQISGKIVDVEKKGVDLALISLQTTTDSSFVKSEFTNQDGSYQLLDLKAGDYILSVNLLGYKTFDQLLTINESKVLEPIVLITDEKTLSTVTVNAKVPFIERKIDRVVVSPDALIANAGSNAMEVLERTPGVSIDNNGSILLKGRSGVTVFINDKPSYLSGTEMENYLRGLPAGSIKQIEIMENPPAKYEAAGNSGVINIIIKRNTLKGFNGNTALSYRRSKYNGSNNSLNLSYNKNKFSLYSNIYAGFWENFQDLFINRYYRDEDNTPSQSFNQNSFNQRNGAYLNGKIGLDFYPSDRLTLGVSFKGVNQPGGRTVDNTSLVSEPSGILLQRVVADNKTESSFTNGLYSFYINKSLDSLGSKISFDADYVQYKTINEQIFKNLIYGPDDIISYEDQINGDVPSDIKIYAVKTDFERPLKNGSKFEAGLKSAFSKTDNEAIYSLTINEVTEPDYELSNNFLYDEWINSGYINYKKTIGKVDIQAGLRGEITKLNGRQLGNIEKPDTSFTRNYASLFPTFYAAMKLDTAGNNSLNLSYGRRIDRPYFQDLNPFIRPLDKFTFYGGNPDLLPTYSHNISLNHSYKGFLNTSLGYSITTDGINETLEIREGIYYSRPGNISSSETFTLSVDGNFDVNKWYGINSYLELGHRKFNSNLYTEQLNSSGNYVSFSITNTFKFGASWKASLSGRYRSNIVSAQLLIKSYHLMNFGLSKTILENKGSLKLAVSDPFYTRRGNGIINNLRLTDADWNSKYDSRNATITFSYRFGNSVSGAKKHNGSGSDSEQRRVKT